MLNFHSPTPEGGEGRIRRDGSGGPGETLQARERPGYSMARFAAYLEKRKKFRSLLKADEYKYFAFQLWQEGIARYTEIRLAELAVDKYEPSQAFRGAGSRIQELRLDRRHS